MVIELHSPRSKMSVQSSSSQHTIKQQHRFTNQKPTSCRHNLHNRNLDIQRRATSRLLLFCHNQFRCPSCSLVVKLWSRRLAVVDLHQVDSGLLACMDIAPVLLIKIKPPVLHLIITHISRPHEIRSLIEFERNHCDFSPSTPFRREAKRNLPMQQ